MKHKHADLIHAWADGAEIQKAPIITFANGQDPWVDEANPDWEDDRWVFRIKPEEKKPVVRWLWADKDGYIANWMYSEEEAIKYCKEHIKLEWSRTEFPE